MTDDAPRTEHIEALLRQLDRERRARGEAEVVAESRLRELVDINRTLDHRVEERTHELATALEAAGAAARVKRSFLAHVGNALETPMHGILGNIELIDRAQLSDDDAQRLDTAAESAEKLAAIIDGLMQLAASEGRPFTPVMELRSPTAFLESVDTIWQRRLAAKGQLLLTELIGTNTEADHEVLTDWRRLQSVADHVLDNVRLHARPGKVVVTLEHLDGLLRLVVTDSGPGIPEEHWESVLLPFFWLEHDAGSSTHGVGIGLAVAARLLESVGGSISVRTNAVGGTDVTSLMPIERRSRQRPDAP
jgi:signal transduction histidine kinase